MRELRLRNARAIAAALIALVVSSAAALPATAAGIATGHPFATPLPPFAVTFRFGGEVLGPEPALDVVLPAARPAEGGVRQMGGAPQSSEIWIGLAPSRTLDRLSALARATAAGRPVTGSCEIAIRVGDASARRYSVRGCVVRRVEATSSPTASWRVMLGYESITSS